MKFPYSKAIRSSIACAAVGAACLAGHVHAKNTPIAVPGPGKATSCSPIKGLGYKFTPRATDAGLVVMSVDYAVVPCDRSAPGKVVLRVVEKSSGVQVYGESAAPFVAKTKVPNLKARTYYTIVLSVYDAANNLIESRSVDALYIVTSV